MRFVNECYPGGFYPEVRYINLAGDGGSVAKKGGGWAHRFCRLSYRLTDRGTEGRDVVGDGTFFFFFPSARCPFRNWTWLHCVEGNSRRLTAPSGLFFFMRLTFGSSVCVHRDRAAKCDIS